MTMRPIILLCLLGAAACSQRDNEGQNAAVIGAAINRADDAPGNAATAPVPVSGSGETPPNAPAENQSDNAATP